MSNLDNENGLPGVGYTGDDLVLRNVNGDITGVYFIDDLGNWEEYYVEYVAEDQGPRNKITNIKVKKDDGTYSNPIPIAVFAENVNWDGSYNIKQILGNVNMEAGDVQTQINNLNDITSLHTSQIEVLNNITSTHTYQISRLQNSSSSLDDEKMNKNNPTGTGSFSLNRKANTTIGQYSIAVGGNIEASGVCSHAEGGSTIASGNYSHTEGGSTIASESCSHAEGSGTTASGVSAHAEGAGTTASGYLAHAEGGGSRATSEASHAEGSGTLASGQGSHSLGSGTVASGQASHAEGGGTIASGMLSHAEGGGTIAASWYQHVFGRLNIVDNNKTYIEIVGNGDQISNVETRSNARTLDWNGNLIIAGNLTYNNGTSLIDQMITIFNNFAHAYDSTATYNINDIVIYDNQLYKCNTAITTAEDWDSTKWDTTTISDELKLLRTNN